MRSPFPSLPKATPFVVIALLLSGVPAFLPSNADALSLAAGGLLLTGETVYADGTFVMTEPLVVAPGATLVIRDATVYFDAEVDCRGSGATEYCQPSILVLPGGRLEVVRSTLDTRRPLADGWVTYVYIRAAGGVLHFEDSLVQHVLRVAVTESSAGPSTFRGTTFRDGASAILASKHSRIEVEGSTFEDLFFAILFDDAAGSIRGSTFRRAPNYAVGYQATSVGEKFLDSTLEIVGNRFEGNRLDLLGTISYPMLVEGNTFVDTTLRAVTVGMNMGDQAVNMAGPRILGNRFVDTPESIAIYHNTQGRRIEQREGAVVKFNSFEGTRCKELWTAFFQDTVRVYVDATENWWGSPEGPQDHGPECPAVSGHGITYEPWLTAPPS